MPVVCTWSKEVTEGDGRSGRSWGDCGGEVHLVEEGEALRALEPALLELHHDASLAQQDHLAVLLVEVDASGHVLEPVLEEGSRHLAVGEAGYEGGEITARSRGDHGEITPRGWRGR